MTGTLYNISTRQNATCKLTLTLTDSSGKLVDLTNATAKLQVRAAPGTAVLLELSTSNTLITLGGTAGTIVWDTIVTIAPVNAVYDLIVTFQNGEVWPIIRGSFIVYPGIAQ